MRGAGTLANYVAEPVGKFWVGRTFIVWWASEALNGTVFWEKSDESDIGHLMRAYDAELASGVSPHASLIDARRLTAVDLAAFNALSRYLETRREPFSQLVTKQALLRPEGMAGAVVAGFYAVREPSYPVEVFTEPTAALDWLGVRELLTSLRGLDWGPSYSSSCRSRRLRMERRSTSRLPLRCAILVEYAWSLLPGMTTRRSRPYVDLPR